VTSRELIGVSADRFACLRLCGLHSAPVTAGKQEPGQVTRASRMYRYLEATLLLSVGAGTLLSWWMARRPLPRLDGSMAIGGLRDGVIVDRDGWVDSREIFAASQKQTGQATESA
jgi:hypothetical protein